MTGMDATGQVGNTDQVNAHNTAPREENASRQIIRNRKPKNKHSSKRKYGAIREGETASAKLYDRGAYNLRQTMLTNAHFLITAFQNRKEKEMWKEGRRS